MAGAIAATVGLVAAPHAAHAAGIEVSGATLRVTLGSPPSGSGNNGAQVHALPDGGAIVSLHGAVNSSDRTVGPGCQQVASSNADALPPPFPGNGSAVFAATCSLAGVRVLEGRLRNVSGSQGWLSGLALPTNVTSLSNTQALAGQGGDHISTGAGGDRITGAAEHDVIDAGGAPYKGQEALPPTGNTALDDPNRNIVDGGAGNDTVIALRATGRDVVTGGAGMDLITYADRFPVGAPGAAGVQVSLDGVANDGNPNIDQLDSAAAGEGDNIATDVENVTGTKREDTLVGSAAANVLFGDEGVDVLTGGSGEDVILAREPATAGSGTADVINCGSPSPSKTGTSTFGVFSTESGSDRLQADLADPKPTNCELLVDMAVDEPAPVGIARSARLTGKRLAVRLRCPRKALRTCAGDLRMAGVKAGSKTVKFSIAGGTRRTVSLRLTERVASALARKGAVARILSTETGREGAVSRVELLRVRRPER